MSCGSMAFQELFTRVVMINLDILSKLIEDGIGCNMKGSLIITKELHRMLMVYIKGSKKGLEPSESA